MRKVQFAEVLKRAGGWVMDLLIPKRCVGCKKEGSYICDKCEIFLSEVENTIPGVISVWEYEGLMEKLIYKIKFDGMYHIIDELVEKAMDRIDLKLPASPKTANRGGSENTIITYVPIWKKKEKERGFNQAELIAKKVAEITGSPVGPVLAKIKDNRSQVGLNPQERIENVKGVFRLLTSDFKKLLKSEVNNILLVDDVYTTGATMQECIKVLKKGGAKNIWGFTLSRKMNIQNY